MIYKRKLIFLRIAVLKSIFFTELRNILLKERSYSKKYFIEILSTTNRSLGFTFTFSYKWNFIKINIRLTFQYESNFSNIKIQEYFWIFKYLFFLIFLSKYFLESIETIQCLSQQCIHKYLKLLKFSSFTHLILFNL